MKITTQLGIFLIIFGLGSFILPFLGFQFKIFMFLYLIFGEYAWTVSVLGILAGIILVIASLNQPTVPEAITVPKQQRHKRNTEG